jgi:hypothetical protein
LVTADQSDRLNGRDGDIWQAYIRGTTQPALAKRHGISQQRISQIIAEARAAVTVEQKEDQIARSLDLIGELRRQMMALVDAVPIPAYSNGRPVLDANGHGVDDHSGRLAAVDRVIKLEERAAKLLGLDAPAKVQSEGTVRYSIDGVNPEDLK